MKIRLIPFFLGIAVLRGSLSTCAQLAYSFISNAETAALESLLVAIFPTLIVEEQELADSPLSNCIHAKAYTVQRCRSVST